MALIGRVIFLFLGTCSLFFQCLVVLRLPRALSICLRYCPSYRQKTKEEETTQLTYPPKPFPLAPAARADGGKASEKERKTKKVTQKETPKLMKKKSEIRSPSRHRSTPLAPSTLSLVPFPIFYSPFRPIPSPTSS